MEQLQKEGFHTVCPRPACSVLQVLLCPSPTRSRVNRNQVSLSVLKDYFVSAKEQWVTGPPCAPKA